MQRALLLGWSALLLLPAAAAHAQRRDCLRRSMAVHISAPASSVPLELTPAHLAANFRNRPLHVTAIGPEQRPRRLVILMDASGSIRGGTTAGWEATIEAASQLVDAVRDVETAITIFAERVEIVTGPTTQHDRLAGEIENLRSGLLEEGPRRQRTAIWDSLLDAMQMFGPLQPGDVLYVITDGVDNFSESRPPMVTQALISAGVRLFAFALANQGFAYGSGELERMVQDTGGVLTAASPSDWRAFHDSPQTSPIALALREQNRQILGFRRLEVELDESVPRPQPWQLAVTGLEESQLRNIVVNYPARLFPCTETPETPVANSSR